MRNHSASLKIGVGISAFAMLLASQPAQAQLAPPTNVVSVCSGVSLPPSVVTDILRPVINGVVTPVENTVNPILGGLGGLLPFIPNLSIDADGLLNTAASGAPIRLQVLNSNGTLVGPGDPCEAQADSISLLNPAGLSIGGNRITGLGATGQDAFAGEINSIAFGNLALTDASALGSIAIGQNAEVGVGGIGSIAIGRNAQVLTAGSVALGDGSIASRGVPEISVGAVGAERLITNVAAGTAATDAANVGQVAAVAADLDLLEDNAVTYSTPAKDRITLAGPTGTVIGNLGAGEVSATSLEAVNGSQLFATNQAVAANTAAIASLAAAPSPVRYSDPAAPTVPNGGTPTNNVTLVGANAAAPVGLHNIADGAVVAGSTDAVNGGQLAATNQAVADLTTNVNANTTAIANLDTRVTNIDDRVTTNTNAIANLDTQVTNNSTAITNLDARITDNSTAIANIDSRVTDNSTAITNLTTQVNNGAVGAVRYSTPGSPNTPNGGTITNDVTLVGADAAAPVGLHNVANGVVAAGSTDAVNGGQLFAVAAAAANSVSYDTDASGNRTNTITLAGGNAAAPVRIANVANGTVAAGSTDAVNGGQLATTNAAVAVAQDTANNALGQAVIAQNAAAGAQTTANTALALGQNSVQYDAEGTSVTFNPTGAATVLRNVAAGVAPMDAVNLGQFNAGLADTLNRANAYTDQRFAEMDFDLRSTRRDALGGTATALAVAGLPQAYEAGKGMIAMAGATYGGESAFAFGLSKAFNDGITVVKLSGSRDSRGRTGVTGGVGFQF